MKRSYKSEFSDLRQKAEELLITKISKSDSPLSENDTLKLIHELEVHQIELELQNKELNEARSAALLTAEKFTELYDFSPTCYFSLSKKGEIIETNEADALYANPQNEYTRKLINAIPKI